MSNVEFNEDARTSSLYQNTGSSAGQSKMTSWLLARGIIKDANQGPVVLLGIAILCIILTIFVIVKFVL